MNDPLNFSFGFGGASVDVNALVRWFKEAPVRTVAYRFLKLFNEHGVRNTQIQRLIPQVTLDKVSDPIALLPALTDDVLIRAAKLFGVQRAWLDGVEESAYPWRGAYKNPRVFFETLASLKRPNSTEPMRAYCATPNLDRMNPDRQLVVLVFVEHLIDWNDGELVRFHPLTEEWPWGYRPARLQLKAMLRAAYDHLGIRTVPLYPVDAKTLQAMSVGHAIPPDVERSHDVSLEDYVLSPQYDIAKETEELEAVDAHRRELKIDEMAAETAEHLRRIATKSENESRGLPDKSSTYPT